MNSLPASSSGHAIALRRTFRRKKKIITQPYYIGEKPPRYYQQVAINRTVEAITKGQNRILLVMATGTGKGAAGSIRNTPSGNWYSTSFSSAVFQYINLRGITQLRLRFTKDDNDDGGADYLKFYSGNAIASYRPQLIIVYYVP